MYQTKNTGRTLLRRMAEAIHNRRWTKEGLDPPPFDKDKGDRDYAIQLASAAYIEMYPEYEEMMRALKALRASMYDVERDDETIAAVAQADAAIAQAEGTEH